MGSLFRSLALLCAISLATPASAGTAYHQAVAERVAPTARLLPPPQPAARLVSAVRYGPFRVVDEETAEVVGLTDERSPAAFRAMLRDYPRIALLSFVDCGGTYNDDANLALARMIRAAGLAVEVPAEGSVRSGGVELFLAGTRRWIDDDAQFGVHAWQDEDGYEATDYSLDWQGNAKYLAYYREMGMSADQAVAFYAMTNESFEHPRYLTGAEMRRWIGHGERAEPAPAPKIAYLDLGLALY